MSRLLLTALIVACGCTTLQSNGAEENRVTFKTSQPSLIEAEKRAPAPNPIELTLKRLETPTRWNIAEDRGSVVLLDVWATWCEPCREALPLYDELAKQFGDRGLKVYAINVDEDGTQIAKFLSEVKISLPVLIDPGAITTESTLHVKLMPTAYLIDRKGIVREVHEGFSDDAKPKYVAEIERLLAEVH